MGISDLPFDGQNAYKQNYVHWGPDPPWSAPPYGSPDMATTHLPQHDVTTIMLKNVLNDPGINGFCYCRVRQALGANHETDFIS